MTELSRGANAPLAGSTVDLAVSGARQGAVDLMVFQLGADHKVRSDADFVFFNQPSSPEGAVRLTGPDRVAIDLGSVPPQVQTLAVAVSLDDGERGSLASVPGLGVRLTAGNQAITAPALGLTTERAAVLVEVYRRGPEWKARNVSAGWSAGLAALATEHGVVVDAAPPAPDPLPSPYLTPGTQQNYPPPTSPQVAPGNYSPSGPAGSAPYSPPPVPAAPAAAWSPGSQPSTPAPAWSPGGQAAQPPPAPWTPGPNQPAASTPWSPGQSSAAASAAATGYPGTSGSWSPGSAPTGSTAPASPGGFTPPGGDMAQPSAPAPFAPGGFTPPGGDMVQPSAPTPFAPGGFPPPGTGVQPAR